MWCGRSVVGLLVRQDGYTQTDMRPAGWSVGHSSAAAVVYGFLRSSTLHTTTDVRVRVYKNKQTIGRTDRLVGNVPGQVTSLCVWMDGWELLLLLV